jgi:hypothetical protein
VPKIERKILRVIDANLNRVKEGLRVCEDTSRFILDSPVITAQFKDIRHRISAALKTLGWQARELLVSRDILRDVGTKTTRPELLRRDFRDVFSANIQRAKESVRVLEEFTKIYNQKAAGDFKNLRYRIYHLEKLVMARFAAKLYKSR